MRPDRIAVFPGSFDPLTNGHLDIAQRAASIFDQLIIAIYEFPSKSLTFSTQERIALWQENIPAHTNISVDHFSGLLTEFAHDRKAQVIIRGLRAVTDFELEFQQALMYDKLAPDIQVMCMITNLQHIYVSSTLIKEVARLHGDLDGLVPPSVAVALQKKFSRRYPLRPVKKRLASGRKEEHL